MQPISGAITFSTTGLVTVSLPFTPSRFEFVTGGKYGVNETTNARHGKGYASSSYQWCTAELANVNGYFTQTLLNTACFLVLDGSGVPAVKGSLSSIGTNSVTFNLTNASALFPVLMTVYP